WGERRRRTVVAAPGASGIGVDLDEELLARGRENARRRGLAERVSFATADPGGPADVAICVGSEQAYGSQEDALQALRRVVRPGGVLLLGTAYWRAPPTASQAAALGATPESVGGLAWLVGPARAADWRPLDIQTASEDEWNAFESGYLADWEEWIHRNPDHPDADATRAAADTHREQWLAGYRDILGFAYLTLSRA